MSKISMHLAESIQENCLVVHPVNPPFAIPLVELVPSPKTKLNIVNQAKEIMQNIGQSPVVLHKELPGFLLNRLQYALLAEAFRLVDDGCASPEDVDLCIKDGLARRWAFIGPFQTIDLNAPNGVKDYCQRYSSTILDIVKTQDNSKIWSENLIEKVNSGCREMNGPEAELSSVVDWRNERLANLDKHLNDQISLKQFKLKKD